MRAFDLEHAEVRWPYNVYLDGVLIEQIDGVVHAGSLSCLVESKDYQRRINVEPMKVEKSTA